MSANLLDVFKTVKVILKFDKVRIDNNISRLHYKLTVIVLVVFSLLVTFKQYFGEPIQCHLSKEDGLNLDAYCWIFSTFTVKKHHNGTPGKDIVAAGVATATEYDEIISQKYYQWVCFVLALQAGVFYTPRHLWKTWEAGRLKMLVGDLGSPIVSTEWTAIRKKNLLKYIAITYRNTHNIYAFRYIFCEFLNFVNVASQIYLIDKFLGGTFTTYGPKILKLSEVSPEERVDPMSYVFPKVAKCTYRSVGPSGTIELRDALCKYTNHKGRNRRFTNPEELEEQRRKDEQERRWRQQRGDESSESEEEEEVADKKKASGSKTREDDDSSASEDSSESENSEEEKAKGVSNLIKIENPNRVQKKVKKLSTLNEDLVSQKPQLSRREREEIEKQRAQAHYQKLHAEGKTEQARADLARLAIIKQQREEAAKKRDLEKKQKEEALKAKTAQTQKALGKKT